MVRLPRSHYKALADLQAASLLLLVILFFSRELVNSGKEGNQQHWVGFHECQKRAFTSPTSNSTFWERCPVHPVTPKHPERDWQHPKQEQPTLDHPEPAAPPSNPWTSLAVPFYCRAHTITSPASVQPGREGKAPTEMNAGAVVGRTGPSAPILQRPGRL